MSGHYATVIMFIMCALKTISSCADDERLKDSSEHLDGIRFNGKTHDVFNEFVREETKKLNKREAPLRKFFFAIAEPDGEDYYDKGQGESDGEDYYEKREWSDVYRQAQHPKHSSIKLDHPDLTDIDGVVLSDKHHATNHNDKQKKQPKKKHEDKQSKQTTSSSEEVATTKRSSPRQKQDSKKKDANKPVKKEIYKTTSHRPKGTAAEAFELFG